MALIRGGTEEHAVEIVRNLRGGADIKSILDGSSVSPTANLNPINDASSFSGQEQDIHEQEAGQNITHSDHLDATRAFAVGIGKLAVLQDIINHPKYVRKPTPVKSH